jgi:two-component system nitrate/nitrite response regulator NarL
MEPRDIAPSRRLLSELRTRTSPAAPDGNRGGAPAFTLVIASEVRFLRESLGALLSRDGCISVLGYGADFGQTLRLSQELRPDMVLLDAAIRDGPPAARQLREARADLLVVAFALIETVDSVLAWAEAGVTGYVPNTAATSDLESLITDISTGRQTCSPLVAAGLLRRIAGAAEGSARQASVPGTLTPRELEIASLISTGLSNKEIARRLNIGLATTKSHVHNALGKLNVQRRGQVARWMSSGSVRG